MTPDSYFFDYNPKRFTHSFYYKDIVPDEDEVIKLNWHFSDDQKKFKRNLEIYKKLNSPAYNSLKYYTHNPVTYKLNHFGFRDEPLSSKPKELDLFLGCSFTFGTGLRLEDTWTYKLTDKLKYPTLNAGLPGSGVMTQFRALLYLSNKFKIRNIFHIAILSHTRYEWWEDNKYNFDKVNINTIHNYKDTSVRILYNTNNLSFKHSVFYHAFLGLCKTKNINYYPIHDLEEVNKLDNTVSNMIARDIVHPSVQKNHEISLHFFNMIKNIS